MHVCESLYVERRNMKDPKNESSAGLNQSATAKSMQSIMTNHRPRSLSYESSPQAEKKPRRLSASTLEALIKAEFAVFIVLAVAVALLHFKLNRMRGEDQLTDLTVYTVTSSDREEWDLGKWCAVMAGRLQTCVIYMVETAYKHFAHMPPNSLHKGEYTVPDCFNYTALLRGAARGVLLPGYWTFLQACVSSASEGWYSASLALFLAAESGAMLCSHRFGDVMHIRSIGLKLGLVGMCGAAAFVVLAGGVPEMWQLPLLLVAGVLLSVWSGSSELLELNYISEDCCLDDRPKAFKQVSFMRDLGLFLGVLAALGLVYLLRDFSELEIFYAVCGVITVCVLGYCAAMKWVFSGVSIYMKLALTRKLDLSYKIPSLDITTISELCQRDQEHSFLHDSRLHSPRTCGLILAVVIAASFQFAKAVMCVALPRITVEKWGVEKGEMMGIYGTFATGVGLGLIVLAIGFILKPTTTPRDRNQSALLLALSALSWTLLDFGASPSAFVIFTTMVTLVGVQSSSNLFHTIVGPKDARGYMYLFVMTGMLGNLAGAMWSVQQKQGAFVFLPTTALDAIVLVLMLVMWEESLPHVEFLKKAKYFYRKELKYPDEVRREASDRLWEEELTATMEVRTQDSGEADYRLKRPILIA